MADSKAFVFLGSFIFGLSIIFIILAMLFGQAFDPKIKESHFEVFLGWLGATIISGGMALKMYLDSDASYGGEESAGDSTISFVSGLSLTLYALLATWLYIIEVPTLLLTLTLLSSAMSFVGIIMVSYFISSPN